MIRMTVIVHFIVITFFICWVGDLLNENKTLVQQIDNCTKQMEQEINVRDVSVVLLLRSFKEKIQKAKDDCMDKIISVEVTAYPPLEEHTDSSPHTTASNNRVKSGIVALSPDLEKEYGYKFGDTITLCLDFIFDDRMNQQIEGHAVDVFMWSLQDAKYFGRTKGKILFLEEG